LYSQNLVLNSSFEEYSVCPSNYGLILYVKNWELSNKLSSDYVNICDTISSPFRENGFVKPRTGNGCGAFNDYFESVVGTLSKPLSKDSLYEISAYVYLSPKSNVYLDKIGVYLESYTNGYILNEGSLKYGSLIDTRLKIPPTIIIDCKTCFKNEWIKVSTIYKAIGGEGLLCIGSPKYIKNSKVFYEHKLNLFKDTTHFKLAYYYIDDVSLIPYHPPIAINKSVSVYDILFDINSSKIQPNSFAYLNNLSEYFNADTTIKIEISGHTDNTGNDTINNSLSLERAQSVKNYLISKGILPERIKTFGYGSTRPIVSNATSVGKAKNRRIEFKLIN